MINIKNKIQNIFDRLIHGGEEPELPPKQQKECNEIMDEEMRKIGGRRFIEAPGNSSLPHPRLSKESFMEEKKKKLNRIEVVGRAFRIFNRKK